MATDHFSIQCFWSSDSDGVAAGWDGRGEREEDDDVNLMAGSKVVLYG